MESTGILAPRFYSQGFVRLDAVSTPLLLRNSEICVFYLTRQRNCYMFVTIVTCDPP